MDTVNVNNERAAVADGSQAVSGSPASVDPVCGMRVSDPSALHMDHGGASYSFCSAACRDAFVSEPARYAT